MTARDVPLGIAHLISWPPALCTGNYQPSGSHAVEQQSPELWSLSRSPPHFTNLFVPFSNDGSSGVWFGGYPVEGTAPRHPQVHLMVTRPPGTWAGHQSFHRQLGAGA